MNETVINMTIRDAVDLKCSINQQHAASWPLKIRSDFNIKNNEESFLKSLYAHVSVNY